ncbi:MAG: deoxyribodipyrimidine photo-lyase, partial [Lentimonas sp.]
APSHVLERAGIRIGDTYPAPLIDHKAGRERALAALAQFKK